MPNRRAHVDGGNETCFFMVKMHSNQTNFDVSAITPNLPGIVTWCICGAGCFFMARRAPSSAAFSGHAT